MVDVSAETEVFSNENDGKTVVLFLGKRNHDSRSGNRARIASNVLERVEQWRAAGWRTSVGDMFGDTNEPTVYETGFAHDIDIAGVFEAPSMAAAYAGIDELQAAGWDELFVTEWMVGLREFVPVPSPRGRDFRAPWAVFALWEWNDAWQAASAEERREYDRECDEAFTFDVESGVSIAGRHRLDVQSRWHHLGIWEAPTFDHITNGMLSHERVADFKFTTSRHYVGRRRPLSEYLGAFS